MINIFSSASYFLPPLIGVVVALTLLTVALLWSRRDFSTGLFCGLLVSIAVWNFLVFGMRASPDIYHALLWEKWLGVAAVAGFVFYYHFTLVYTNTKRQRRILYISYSFLVVITILAPTDLFIEGMRVEYYGYAPIVGAPSYLLFGVGPLLVIGGAINLLRHYRLSDSRDERTSLACLIAAALFPLMGAILDGFTNLPPASVWTNLIFCILCSIAVLKYHLLDIRVILRKSLVYVVVSAAVAIPYAGMLILLHYIFQPLTGVWVHAALILFLAIILRPLYSWAQQLVDRLFYRDRYDYLRALERFSHEAQNIVNLEKLGSNMVQLVSGALRTSSACLLLAFEDRGGFVMVASNGLDNPPNGVILRDRSVLVQWLRLHSDILFFEDFDIFPQLQSLSHLEKNNLEQIGAKLFVPIKSFESKLSGVLVLGAKLSHQAYFDEDKQLLMALRSQMAMAFENARLYEETRRSEKALRESEKKYEELAESITDLFFAMDEELRCTYWNRASEELIGVSAKDALGKYLDQLFPDIEATRRAKEVYLEVLRSKQPQHFVDEYQLKDKDFFLEIMVYPKENGLAVFARDISERKQAEEKERQLQEELNRSSRLASIGELAAGVAHEINNPLTGILGFSQRLLRKSTDERIKQDLERICTEAWRAARVVGNLLTFARHKESKKEYSNINDILERALELRAYELKTSNIEVVTELASALPPALVDFQQIQQVFLNIIINAEQAIIEAKDGGQISIKTQEKQGYVTVTFTDDGPGIPKENLDRVFDPFFTLRKDKGGTGLGLSICHGIVTEHGGRIYARSKPGKGATFFVELPLTIAKIDEGKVPEKEPPRIRQ